MKEQLEKKIVNKILLLAVPIVYILLGFFFQSERPYYFMYSVDPEYCYLFNGLNVSQFTLKVWHVDHPGTPIQFLAALVIRVVHLFYGKGPLITDVMQNSWLYVKAINITMFSLNAIGLFFLGKAAYRYTQKYIQSIFIQFMPFTSFLVLTLIFRINPENMAILCFILMGILIFKYLQQETESKIKNDKILFGFAITTGLAVAVKMTFLPIFFLPFFLFKGFKKKLLYSLASGLAFFVFIIPVIIYRHEYFYNWIKNLFIHSGKYGGGDANVVDPSAFSSALTQTFSFEYFFSVSFFVFLVACIIYNIPKIKEKFRNDKPYRILLGVTVTMTLMILLVAKQFTFHYLTPALLPVSIGLWAVVMIFFSKPKSLYTNLIFIAFILIFLSFDYKKINEYHPVELKKKEAAMQTYEFIMQHPSDKPLVIVPSYYGCPYQQYSLYFGLFWGGEVMKPRYTEVLKEVYPNTYFYNGWDELFHDWPNDGISYADLLKKHHDIRMYVGDSTIENDVLKYIMKNLWRMDDTKVTKIFSNETTNENIYEISCDTSFVMPDSVSILCNADSVSSDGIYFVGTRGQSFKDAVTQCSDKAFSGKYSAKLEGDKKYGMTYIIGQVRAGEHYRVSVWRNNDNNVAQLVISARNGSDFYVSEIKTVEEKNGWGKIQLDITIPDGLNNKELRIYAYNDTGSPAYFDDMKILATKQ